MLRFCVTRTALCFTYCGMSGHHVSLTWCEFIIYSLRPQWALSRAPFSNKSQKNENEMARSLPGRWKESLSSRALGVGLDCLTRIPSGTRMKACSVCSRDLVTMAFLKVYFVVIDLNLLVVFKTYTPPPKQNKTKTKTRTFSCVTQRQLRNVFFIRYLSQKRFLGADSRIKRAVVLYVAILDF